MTFSDLKRAFSRDSRSSATDNNNGNNNNINQLTPSISRSSTYSNSSINSTYAPPSQSNKNTYEDGIRNLRSPSAVQNNMAPSIYSTTSQSQSQSQQQQQQQQLQRSPSVGIKRSDTSPLPNKGLKKERSGAGAVIHKALHGREERKQERDFISQYCDDTEIPRPEEITEKAHAKGLGQSSKNLKVEDFELVKTLGTGTFARVWLVRVNSPKPDDKDKVFALKVLKKANVVKLKQVDHVNHERAILADVAGHPFITTLITTFADHDHLYMLLDYCPGGEIFSYLRKQKRFNEETARFYIAEIVLIFEYLHEQEGVAYRDLKPENLLLDAQGHVKLVDFGFAKRVRDRETYTLCGTPEYLAPEVIQSQGHGTAVDWWALGILLYEFVVGYPPFWSSHHMEIYKQIIGKPIHFSTSASAIVSPDTQDLIRQFCTVDRSQRLGNTEGGARRVKAHPFFKDVNWDETYNRKHRGPIIPPIRFVGDTSCFDSYPEEGDKKTRWSRADASAWDEKFKDF